MSERLPIIGICLFASAAFALILACVLGSHGGIMGAFGSLAFAIGWLLGHDAGRGK